MPKQSLSSFLCEAQCKLRNIRQHFNNKFRGHFKRQNHHKKKKTQKCKCKTKALNRPERDHLLIGWEQKEEDRPCFGQS